MINSCIIRWARKIQSYRNPMVNRLLSIFYSALLIIICIGGTANSAFAQLVEPEIEGMSEPRTPLSEGYHNTIGFDVTLNNFGFGAGGYYARVVGPYTEITLKAGITGLRDVSEQNFQNFFTGQQIVPNKYKRALGFPFLLGLRQRIFAHHIEDDFRLFIGAAAGPSMAFVYPYVQDTDENGFRTFQVTQNGRLAPVEPINDFFSGWSNGETEWGLNGEITIGADIGSSFSSRTTVEFGYFFYYFDQGLQLMEPRRPIYSNEGVIVETESFFDAQKYFGTPVIKFTFGGMW